MLQIPRIYPRPEKVSEKVDKFYFCLPSSELQLRIFILLTVTTTSYACISYPLGEVNEKKLKKKKSWGAYKECVGTDFRRMSFYLSRERVCVVAVSLQCLAEIRSHSALERLHHLFVAYYNSPVRGLLFCSEHTSKSTQLEC